MRPETIVLKLGSSVLPGPQGFGPALLEIYREVRRGRRVVVVVSAFPGVTARLLRAAGGVSGIRSSAALASLVSTGEVRSAALLSLELEAHGVPNRLLDPSWIGLRVEGEPLDADPVELDSARLIETLERFAVVVVPGFFGRTQQGDTALLGRGGSDLTALYLARELSAQDCRLIKDVDGVFDGDPKRFPNARRFESLPWEVASALAQGLVQPKALDFAARHRLPLSIASLLSLSPTRIGDVSLSYRDSRPARRLRVALAGLGVVGAGVAGLLGRLRERFELVGAAVRDPSRNRGSALGVALTDHPASLLAGSPDVLIELIGGEQPALGLIREALTRSIHVVTANKRIVARHGSDLERMARAAGVSLRYSASVGGAVPMLEKVGLLRDSAPISRLEGVLNGTCNFILGRLADGIAFDDAVREAQGRGFAEADPGRDLEGLDAAEKLSILARQAFSTNLDPERMRIQGICGVTSEQARAAREEGWGVCLVASCDASGRAEVRPLRLPVGHPLASVEGEDNRLLVELQDGRRYQIEGKGAGRWPTSLAVVADLLSLQSRLSSCVALQSVGGGIR